MKIGNVSSEAVKEATGKDWNEWFSLLNTKGAKDLSHKEIVALLAKSIDSNWWCQKITSGYESAKGKRTLGQVATGGFQMGMQKVFPVSSKEAWDFLTAEEGIAIWLGEMKDLNFRSKGEYTTRQGITGQINVLKEQSHVRLTWKPKGWKTTSTLQVRVMPRNKKATISFHHEGLPGTAEREKMKKHWEKVLARLEKALAKDGKE